MRNKQNNCSYNCRRDCVCLCLFMYVYGCTYVRLCVCVWVRVCACALFEFTAKQPHCWALLRHTGRTTTIYECHAFATGTPTITPPTAADAHAHSQGRHCGSVWRLPLLNNKLYFAAFKSNFLTFFNLNGDDETAPRKCACAAQAAEADWPNAWCRLCCTHN